MAARLWWLARWLGHDAVAVLDGGYSAWLEAKLAVSQAIPSPAPRAFSMTLRNDLVADAAEVERIRTLPDHRIFDARAPERYRGDVEPIDPVAGHIAGARSLPFTENLHGGAHFRSARELRERFLAALAGAPAPQAIVYCGSGVTACHDVLAAEIAGFPGVRLYPGSWSEWILDPERPTARGEEP
jgi:thiosulfate/3-mercaptopyruvate sulfurtransferase